MICLDLASFTTTEEAPPKKILLALSKAVVTYNGLFAVLTAELVNWYVYVPIKHFIGSNSKPNLRIQPEIKNIKKNTVST